MRFIGTHALKRILVASLLVVCIAAAALGAETPIPPAPERWVTDTAGFLSPQTRQTLDARLQQFDRSTGHQVLVYIGDTTGDAPIDDWAVRAFAAWRPGRKGIDDGAVLFLMARDRKVRIEVGYGLEPVLPDAVASRIIRETIVPALQAGNHDAAVSGAVDRILSVISSGGVETAPPEREMTPREAPQRGVGLLQMIFLGVVGVIFLIIFITNPWLAIQLLILILSGGRGGGGGGFGGGGGGFRGGGGRSGGGGASGSW